MSATASPPTGSPPLSEQRLFNTAIGFLEAARRCEQGIPVPNSNPPQFISPIPPAIVSYAFASEILLKAFYINETGSAARGHNLETLFNNLSQGSRDTIESQFKLNSSLDPSVMKNELKKFANAFVEWRYIYENTGNISISLQVLRSFAIALAKALMAKNPQITTTPTLKDLLGLA